MTRDIDIDRVLERWLADGPSVMPERFFNSTLDRIDRTPQRRLGRALTRVATMNRSILYAAAAVVLIVGLGGAAILSAPSSGVKTSPQPSPSASAVAGGVKAPLPAALTSRWVGPTRTVPAISPAPERSGLILSATSLRYDVGGANQHFFSLASASVPGQLSFSLSQEGDGCHIGQIGTYLYTLTPSGRGLTLTPVSDDCAARSASIAGDWNKAACGDPTGWCLGDLDPGTHVSTFFNPFTPLTAFQFSYGKLGYTVPAGWTNTEDGTSGYILAKQGAPDGAAIYVFQTAMADSQAADCPGTPEPGVGHSAADLAAWLGTLPGLQVTPPTDATIGGLHGKTLDVGLAPTWTHTCSFSAGKATVAMFTNGLQDGQNFDWGILAGSRMRLWLLDLPDGRTMLIDVEALDQATWDALVAEATPIVQTFTLTP